MSPAQADELARRHGLERLASQNFPLLGGSTIGLFRIIDKRPPDMVRREFAADAAGGVKSVQFNFRYRLQDQNAAVRGRRLAICDRPASVAASPCARARHELTIAVIDSGVDANIPSSPIRSPSFFDALGSKEGPHVHGTGVAGAIVAHAG